MAWQWVKASTAQIIAKAILKPAWRGLALKAIRQRLHSDQALAGILGTIVPIFKRRITVDRPSPCFPKVGEVGANNQSCLMIAENLAGGEPGSAQRQTGGIGGPMGGYGSGRHGGRPTVEDGLTVDLGLMLRRGWAKDGASAAGTLSWSSNGEPFATISHRYDLTDPDNAHLTLTYTRTPMDGSPEKVEQRIHLAYTRPNYGGRRWWMLCPYSGRRVAKLHLPPDGDKFAARLAWRLPYRSQRSARRDRPFDRLFRLQRKLGSFEGWEAGLRKPKGMWRRTYERHWERYWQLDAQCGVEAMRMIGRL